MTFLPQAQARAKRRAPQVLPCCICEQEHPEDKTNHRMRGHDHLGQPCLGGDIPFAKHRKKPDGKLLGMILPADKLPNRTQVIAMVLEAPRGEFTREAVDRLLAQPADCDRKQAEWMRTLFWLENQAELDAQYGITRKPVGKLYEVEDWNAALKARRAARGA